MHNYTFHYAWHLLFDSSASLIQTLNVALWFEMWKNQWYQIFKKLILVKIYAIKTVKESSSIVSTGIHYKQNKIDKSIKLETTMVCYAQLGLPWIPRNTSL